MSDLSTLVKPTGTKVQTVFEIKIQKNIPLPARLGRQRSGKYLAVQEAMETMQVGDSFVSLIDSKATLAVAKSVRKKLGRWFSTRQEENGVRVWRTK